ncbi:hypothetical protein QYE76_053147 [Lolium multiflorum]|uniref:CCHC-type domain-containing protein n=1 Tax=Lolium multiflorum TaxID=4521 RepID=A0AAD8WLP3_LOLMU|nr:hypothetical protein QYE76_053147 [Lolium multiflorum]
MACHKCGGKGHFERDCPKCKVMIIDEDNEYETGDDADLEAPEDDHYDNDGVDSYPSEAQAIVVSQRALNVQPSASTQCCNLFQTKPLVGPGKVCKVIIDGASCRNLATKGLCAKMNFKYLPHPHPYYIQWLSNNSEMKVYHMVRVDFEIGPYKDSIEFDVVPMTVCHLLLVRPWLYDRSVQHNSRTNTYHLEFKGKKVNLQPMSPQQIVNESRQKTEVNLEDAPIDRRENCNAVSDITKSERVNSLVILATKEDMREFSEDPAAMPLVLMYKGKILVSNDMTPVSLDVSHVLQEFSNVFPEEVPPGFPPLHGIEHQIDLIGASLPNRAPYRMSPEETKEIQKQVQALLDKAAGGTFMSITLGAATKLLDDMMINYSEWHTERTPQGKKVNSVEETSSLGDKIDAIMSMLANGRSHIDPNNVPLASLVAQEEHVDVNFIKNNNFNNNAYRNNYGNNNYRPYPSNNGSGYGNSYGNSYNNNKSVPSGLEVMLKEFISTQTAFNKIVEEKLGKIDVLASKVDSLALDVDLLKLKVMPDEVKDARFAKTNAIQVRINDNIRMLAELHARWDREGKEKLAKENNITKVWTITTTSSVDSSHVAKPPTINGKIIGVVNVSTPSAKRVKLPETAETVCDKTAEIFQNIGDNDPIAVDHNGLDFDDFHIT